MYKSKLIKLANYKDFEVKEDMYEGAMADEEVESIVQRKAKEGVKTAEGESIEKGDVAALDLTSDEAKFNRKNLPLNVGLGMFDAQLEKEILGMKKDETKTIKLDKASVEVKVNSITRRSIPEVNDEFIASLGIDGIKTVKEYKEKLVADDLREKKMGAIPFLTMGYLVDHSEFDIKQEDLDEMSAKQFQSIETEAGIIGKPVEELVKEIYGISIEEIKEWFTKEAEPNLKQILLGMDFAKKNDAMLTEEIYMKDIEANAEKMGMSVEDSKKIFPIELFYGNYYPLQAMKEIYDYYKEIYK